MKLAAANTGLCERQLTRYRNGHSSPAPGTLERLQRAAAGRHNPDAEDHERRLALMEWRAARGLDLWTGGPAPALRPLTDLR